MGTWDAGLDGDGLPAAITRWREPPENPARPVTRSAPWKVLVQRVHEALGVEPRLIRSHQHGQILGHLTAFDGVDDDLLQRLGEVADLGRAVQVSAVLESAGPREDRAIGLVESSRP